MAIRNTAGAFVQATPTSLAAAAGSSSPSARRNGLPTTLLGASDSLSYPIAELSWTSADNDGVNFIYPAISCSLPPGTGIKAVGQSFAAPAP